MNQYHEIIDKYLTGRLSATEQADVLHRIGTDPVFRQEFEEQQHMAALAGMAALQQDLAQLHEQLYPDEAGKPAAKTAQNRVIPLRWWLSAAAVLLIIIVGIDLLFTASGKREQRLFDRYYQQPAGLPTTMGPADDPAFADAMVDYKTGEYTLAISKFNAILSQPGQSRLAGLDTTGFYLAASYMGAGKYDSAANIFSIVTRHGGDLGQKASWFYALSSLRTNDEQMARSLLAEISRRQDAAYHKQAEALLKELQQ